jgi:hypothetical protein
VIDQRLLVPLSCLPGPVPVGAPLCTADGLRVVPLVPPGRLYAYRDDGQPVSVPADARLFLDLGPPVPPLSRVDGMDVGLRLLGLSPEDPDWTLLDLDHLEAVPQNVKEFVASLDPADPLALRLAVAAVLRAGGGR